MTHYFVHHPCDVCMFIVSEMLFLYDRYINIVNLLFIFYITKL